MHLTLKEKRRDGGRNGRKKGGKEGGEVGILYHFQFPSFHFHQSCPHYKLHNNKEAVGLCISYHYLGSCSQMKKPSKETIYF